MKCKAASKPVNDATKKFVIASGNEEKLREISKILSDFDCEIISQSKLGIASVDEIGATFVDNAMIKARHATAESGLPAIADDSGLMVDALDAAQNLASDNANSIVLLVEFQGRRILLPGDLESPGLISPVVA